MKATKPNPKFLIVDDHAVVRRGVQEMLREAFPAAEFGEAGTAQAALGMCEGGDWDLMLLDISMPDKTGLEILEELRACCPKIQVLVQSMHGERQFATRVLKAGAAGYITKQSLPEELIRAVKTVLAGGKYLSESFAERLADASRPPHEALSAREFEVLQRLSRGQSVKEIGAQLGLSIKTVSTYRARLLDKLGMGSNAELARYAAEQGLVE